MKLRYAVSRGAEKIYLNDSVVVTSRPVHPPSLKLKVKTRRPVNLDATNALMADVILSRNFTVVNPFMRVT